MTTLFTQHRTNTLLDGREWRCVIQNSYWTINYTAPVTSAPYYYAQLLARVRR